MQFEEFGFFLSFISYPFSIDGKELFDKILCPFFSSHKKQISQVDSEAKKGNDPYPYLYTPAGYRMFGSQGLALLSLVDDYSFYNRYFNKNHIQSLLTNRDTTYRNAMKRIDYVRSVVISGIREKEESGRTITQVAKDTFLKKNIQDRYHYIGIIRLKIDHRLLNGNDKAVETIKRIKNKISELYSDNKDKFPRFDYFAMDCYDNDELTVVAFADELLPLYNFLGNIRSIKSTDINQDYTDDNGKPKEKHVFGITYLSFGYDLQYDIRTDANCRDYINCVIETKPGHRDVLYKYLKEDEHAGKLEIDNVSVCITGGCTISFTMPLRNIFELEAMCIDTDSVFVRNVRKFKVSLKDEIESDEREKSIISESDHSYTNINYYDDDSGNRKNDAIDREVIATVKSQMKRLGVSKMVRERLLALFELYNLSCQDLLQVFYLNELKPALLSFSTMLSDMSDNPQENLCSIEQMLNDEITNMENACYDRLHVRKNDKSPLEYCGGIQQYLTSFDFVFKQLFHIFLPKDNYACYITISGAERAASERQIFKLNIHDIIFPELFITTVVKEIANFSLKTQQKFFDESLHPCCKKNMMLFDLWYSFTRENTSFNIIQNHIDNSCKLLYCDDVVQRIKKLVSRELLEYFIKDYLVFHFTFCNNYYLMWHFYFKTFLQTTTCYHSLNSVDKNRFVHMLMRLFMVSNLIKWKNSEDKVGTFLDERAEKPFDSIVNSVWVEYFNKTREACKVIFDVLKMYGFPEMIENMSAIYEANLYVSEHPGKKWSGYNEIDVLNERIDIIYELMGKLRDGKLVEAKKDAKNLDKTFILCLFTAYLQIVYELDGSDTDSCLVKCVPRSPDGGVHHIMKCDSPSNNELKDTMIQILVDTTGGFYIPSANIRQQYFKLRTAFYRSLWNYRFQSL